MNTIHFIIICISLYGIISRSIKRNKRYKAFAMTEAKAEAARNEQLNKYRQIADKFNTDYVLRIKGADIQHANLIISEGFIYLTGEGLVLCELKNPDDALVIPYNRFKHFRYYGGDWPTSTDDPIKIIQDLMILKFNLKPLESEYVGSLTSVYFDYDSDSSGNAFNIDSLTKHGNFFAALEKHINKYGSNTIENATKLLE